MHDVLRARAWWSACVLSCGLLVACGTVPSEPSSSPPPAPVAKAPVPTPAMPAAPGKTTPGKKGGGYYLDDGPGENVPPDLATIPDASPRLEPLRAAANRPYAALGATFTPMQNLQPFSQTGVGSWYGKKFHGAKTSSGERYDMYAMTAAHPTLPIPSYARVTNLANGRSVVVRVNDRGPFLHGRVIDLSYVAAWKLGYVDQGSTKLQVDAIVPDELDSFIATSPIMQPPAEPVFAAAAAEAPVMREAGLAEQPAAGSGIFLQLGAFSSSNNADSFREYVQSELKWLQQGVRTQLIGDKYRLHVGPFRDATEARGVGERIAAAIRVQPFVVQR